jgi:transposase
MISEKWYYWATHSRIEPIKEAAYSIKLYRDGVLKKFQSKINKATLEGINSMLNVEKARNRGYRKNGNLITIIYLRDVKLKFTCPSQTERNPL